MNGEDLPPHLGHEIDAGALSYKAGDKFVTAERLLLACALAAGTSAAAILKACGLTPQALNKAIEDLRKGRRADSATAEDSYDALNKYARDLTQAARDGAIADCLDCARAGAGDVAAPGGGSLAPRRRPRVNRPCRVATEAICTTARSRPELEPARTWRKRTRSGSG